MSLHFRVLQWKGGKKERKKEREKKNAHADKPLYFKTGLMVLCRFDWRQHLRLILFPFSAPSVKPGRYGSPACVPGHQPPPLGPWACSSSACGSGTPPGATDPQPGPARSQGMGLSSKICLDPVGTALHEAGELWGSATAGLCAIRTKPWFMASYCMPT